LCHPQNAHIRGTSILAARAPQSSPTVKGFPQDSYVHCHRTPSNHWRPRSPIDPGDHGRVAQGWNFCQEEYQAPEFHTLRQAHERQQEVNKKTAETIAADAKLAASKQAAVDEPPSGKGRAKPATPRKPRATAPAKPRERNPKRAPSRELSQAFAKAPGPLLPLDSLATLPGLDGLPHPPLLLPPPPLPLEPPPLCPWGLPPVLPTPPAMGAGIHTTLKRCTPSRGPREMFPLN